MLETAEDKGVTAEQDAAGNWKPWAALRYAREGKLQPLANVLRAEAGTNEGPTADCFRLAADLLDNRPKRRRGRPPKTFEDRVLELFNCKVSTARLIAIDCARIVHRWRQRHGNRTKFRNAHGRRVRVRDEVIWRTMRRFARMGLIAKRQGADPALHRQVWNILRQGSLREKSPQIFLPN
jgi:hypothetical protein